MTREPVDKAKVLPKLTIPPPILNDIQVQVPITSPGNLQSPLEFWIQSETTPLLTSKMALPPVQETPYEANNERIEAVKNNCVPPDQELEEESSWRVACQVFIPFMIAGLGTVAAGVLLDDVQNWDVFETVPEMFVLVPALLGLKGNLEMTLASRVSTQANLGLIDNIKEQWKLAFGNLALLQCQSIVLGLVASIIASFVGWSREGEFNVHNVFLLTSSSLLTASIASFLLGSVTIVVVICSRRFNINPDNVAAPLSASLGDAVTLALLASLASLQFSLAAHDDDYIWMEVFTIIGILLLVPMWAILAYRCPYTRQVLYSGWVPVISAVGISSGGGYILNYAVASFKEIAACQPVINGIGGNLVAIQACRISTYLHQRSTKPGLMPEPKTQDHGENGLCVSPCVAWFGKSAHARTARTLILISFPAQVIFITMVHFLKSQYTPLTYEFMLLYLAAAFLQVALLLYFAHCLVHWLWKFGIDPDDAAIPYLTATGDLLGTGFLYIAFLTLDSLH